MFNEEFYPTPPEVAKRMWQQADCHRKTVLDPSCGKGDLLEKLNGDFYYTYKDRDGDEIGYWTKPDNLFGIEIEPELQAIAKSKGVTIIGNDFLTTVIEPRIDVIYMNPPFSNGDEHLLRAWDIIAPGGVVVCLLNEETINNPYTKKRELLKNIVEQHGEVENWGPCFANAERPTNVNIACVTLSKPAEKSRFEYKADGFQTEQKARFQSEELVEAGGIVKADMLLALERAYGECKTAFGDLLIALSKAESIASTFVEQRGYSLVNVIDIIKEANTNEQRYEIFVNRLRKQAWKYIIDKTKLRDVATSRLRKDFDSFIDEQSNIAFTKENIIAVIEMLYFNRGSYIQKAVSDVFDQMISFDKENKIHWEGWKTNDAYKVNHKVIMPSVVQFEKQYSSNPWSFSYYGGTRNFLNDIDIAMCFVSGRNINEVNQLENAIANCLKRANSRKDVESTKGCSTFFEFQFYKKGTLHLWFKDKEVWMKFNLIAAAGKMWLPSNDIKAQEAEERDRMKKQKFADAAWVKIAKEKAKWEKVKKAMAFEFNPKNQRAISFIQHLMSLDSKITVQSHPEINNICIVFRNGYYRLLDNTGVFKIYDKEDNSVGWIDFRDTDGKLVPIDKIAQDVYDSIMEEEIEKTDITPNSEKTKPTIEINQTTLF